MKKLWTIILTAAVCLLSTVNDNIGYVYGSEMNEAANVIANDISSENSDDTSDENLNENPDENPDNISDGAFFPYESPAFAVSSVYLIAGGNDFELELEHARNAVYSVSGDTSVIMLSKESSESVTLTPLKAGTVTVTVTATGEPLNNAELSAEAVTRTCQVVVSDMIPSRTSLEIYMNQNDTAEVALKGLDTSAVYYDEETVEEASEITVSRPDVADAWFFDGRLQVTGNNRGSAVVTVSLYGKKINIKVKVYKYTLNKYTINTYKGSPKRTLKVAGTGGKKVTWKSSNPKVAAVNRKGVVKAKNVGTARITATINHSQLVCIYAVSSVKAYKALTKAKKIMKQNTHYSQLYRMSTGYYDCSSLVYRCYQPLGIRFGATTSWAPTAAAEGMWCVNTRHVVARKAVSIHSGKLLPGDTIFFAYSGNNGRYLNISHTAIFAGYAYDDWNGYYGTVIEASSSRDSVSERYYNEEDSTIVLIGRPAK